MAMDFKMSDLIAIESGNAIRILGKSAATT
jgi:hypothetical protein